MPPHTRGGKLALGVLTLWPLVWMAVFVVVWGALMLGALRPDATDPHQVPPAFIAVMAFHCLSMLVLIGLDVFYIVHVVKNPRVDQSMRIVWILVLFFGGFIAMPIYWWVHLWKAPPAPAGA